MNAERLHAICLSIQKEIQDCNIHSNLKQVVDILNRIINQPQHPERQKQLGDALSKLYEQLSNANSDHFSPAWRQAVKEIGGENLLGKKLVTQIRAIFERNQITPSIALDEIQNIYYEFEKFKNGIDNTISGLKLLNIGSEELHKGECEIGFTIPRKVVKNNMNEFGKELLQLNFILGIFSEIASGQRENLKIKSISSSDFSIYMAALPSVAACLAYATDKIIDAYKKLLEIRKIKKELKMLGLKDKEMQGITDHATNFMSEMISNLTSEIIKKYYIGSDDGRKHELANALTISLNKIANRIDKGFNIEVRAEQLEKPEDDKEKKTQEFIHKIIKTADSLQFLKPDGESILCLSEEVKGGEFKKSSKK